MKTGFVYIWRDRKRNMYYIGSHWGKETDGYICSSNRMRDAYRRRPTDFKRRLIESQIIDKKTMYDLEDKWLKRAEKKKERYYNLHFSTHHWSCTDSLNKTVSEKIAEKTKLSWQKPEFRAKMMLRDHSISGFKGKKHSLESRLKIKKARAKQIITEEAKQKMRNKKLSDETKLKISIALKGKKKNRKQCLLLKTEKF